MSLPYYKRFPRDFLDGTIGLLLETKGAYSIVLDLIYMKDGRLPDDARYIAGHLGCSVRKWTTIRAELVAAGKIQIDGGIISNFRADYLLEDHRKYQAQQAENRANPNKNKGQQSPEANQSESQSEPKKEKTDIVVSVPEPTRVFEVLVEPPEVPAAAPGSKSKPWEGDEAFAAFWSAGTDQGRKRSSRAVVWPEWRKALKSASGPDLAAAMVRYVAGDEDAKRTGGPGLHLWLKASRYEHWLADEESLAALPAAVFNGPAALRQAVVSLLGEPFARTWIDSCQWEPEGRILYARNAYARSKLVDELGAFLRKHNLTALVAGESPEPV